MNCDETRGVLYDLLLDLAEPEVELQARSHLDACPACRTAEQRARKALGVLDEWQPRKPRSSFRGALVAVAAGVIGIAVMLYFVLRPSPEPIRLATPRVDALPVPVSPLPRPAPEPPAPPRPAPAPVEAPKPEPEKAKLPEVPPPPPPAPEPRPEPPPAPPRIETIPAVALLDRIEGRVEVGAGPARVRQPLHAGQTVKTIGEGSAAGVTWPDGTRFSLATNTTIGVFSDEKGKRIVLDAGLLEGKVARQPPGLSLVIVTPQGRATVLGTALRIQSDRTSTRLEVQEGSVRLTRGADQKSVEVPAGHFAVAAAGVELQAKPLPPPRVDQAKVDEAVKKGVGYLRGKVDMLGSKEEWYLHPIEIVLWTFVHAGVPDDDPALQKMLGKMVDGPLELTYLVSLQAMILEELDRVKYQWRIHQCAQFLLDNQCQNGQWSYGSPAPAVQEIPRPKTVATGPAPAPRKAGPREKPKVKTRIIVARKRDGNPSGDHSNSQYAALGIRACHEAGILFPVEMVERAGKAWRDTQKDPDFAPKPAARGTPTGPRQFPEGAPRGWCYQNFQETHTDHRAYGSMTAGGVGSLLIYDKLLGVDAKKDKAVLDGMAWLATRFSVAHNPGPLESAPGRPENTRFNYLYYLYALERVGVFSNTDRIGGHDWYYEGVQQILPLQRSDGSWWPVEIAGKEVSDTCLAILFLKRATRSLEDVATLDRFQKR